ncbi:hypothetical protein HUU42_03795 [bacterium]|nr:hypothetical protein [bacterium]
MKLVKTGLLVSIFFSGSVINLASQSNIESRNREDEKELKVKVEYAAGDFSVRKAQEDKLYIIRSESQKTSIAPKVSYYKSGSSGFLNLEMDQNTSVDVFDFGKQNWSLEFSDKIPMSYNFELGACNGEFDFTDLRVKDLTLSMGASKANVYFRAPNRDQIYLMKIEAGASKMMMSGLCNANFEKMEFEGGVGSYILDFSGELKRDARANITVGLGKVIIKVSRNANVKIRTDESFFSTCSISEADFDKKQDGLYLSRNFSSEMPVLDLRVEAGLGKVSIVSTE